MSGQLDVHLLPEHVDPVQLEGSTAVVIDVLRATTVMVEALQAGATLVVPCAEVEAAWQMARTLGPSALLGGERGGVRIERFQLGNSPAEYTAARVAGRPLVVTTTNGTRAILHAKHASCILIGAFTNLSALVNRILEDAPSQVHLLCAGTDGHQTEEDALLAGAIAARVTGALECSGGSPRWNLNAAASSCIQKWQGVLELIPGQDTSLSDGSPPKPLVEALRQTRGGRNLLALGFDADIHHAARVDLHDVVPRFHPRSGQVRLT